MKMVVVHARAAALTCVPVRVFAHIGGWGERLATVVFELKRAAHDWSSIHTAATTFT